MANPGKVQVGEGWCLGASARIASMAGIAGIACLLLGAASGEGPIWRPDGPFGGTIVFAQAASELGRLYAGNFSGQGFASGDGGRRWTPLLGIIPFSGLAGDLAVPLAVAPDDAETVYFRVRRGASERLVRSRDGGNRFVPIEAGLDLAHRFSYDLAIDPGNPAHLTLGTSDGLFQSEDGGNSWRAGAFDRRAVLSIAFDPGQPATSVAIVEGTEGGGAAVWRSTDGGATWTRTASPPRWTSIGRPVWSTTREGTLFVVANGRPFATSDLGATWTLLPLGRRDLYDLAALGDGTLLAATRNGLFRSADGGLTWSPAGPESSEARPREEVFRVEAASGTIGGSGASDRAYAAGSVGLWRTEDSGRTWSPAHRGIRALSTQGLASGAAAYAVFYGAGIFRLGETGWQSARSGPTVRLGATEYSVGLLDLVAVDPGDPGNLFASLGRALVGSRDGGTTWRALLPETPSPENFDASVVTFAPSDPRRVYAAGITSIGLGHGREPALYRSLDRGVSWTGTNAFGDIRALAVDPRHPEVLFAATPGIFAVSRNGGDHWRTAGQGLPGIESDPKALRIDPANPDRLLLATDHEVSQSLDGGATFQPFGQSFGNDTIERLELDASGVYLSVINRGLFRYDPATARWEPIGRRLPAQRFYGLFTLDPHHPGRLYAAVADIGLKRLDVLP